jgi:hypothetical protein
MKLEYSENRWGLSIFLHPETPAEMAQLARVAKNAKAEKPLIYLNFSTSEHYLSLNINKINETKQSNSLGPKDR